MDIAGGVTFTGGLSIAGPPPPSSYKAIFGYGSPTTAITNLVSNTGVVATDTTGVGTARSALAAASYGLS